MLKVQSGWLKGMKLKLATDDATLRPTSHRARAATMDRLRSRLSGARFLDLFAGTGAVGFEALSQGADIVVLVEKNRALGKAIRETIGLCETRAKNQGLPHPHIVLIASDVQAAWSAVDKHGPFDLVWIDPPYALVKQWASDNKARLKSLLEAGACLIVESDGEGQMALQDIFAGFPLDSRKYGSTFITVIEALND
ncbi:MAG: RsmD family RNA methyltransferase [Oligoflexales bacterium]